MIQRRTQGPHQAARLDVYRHAHADHMARLIHFVGPDTLEWTSEPAQPDGVPLLLFQGKIACLGGIVIEVDKALAVFVDGTEDPYVQTESYAYNAWIRGYETFLRYDNAHRHPGHADEHHKHECDWRTGRGHVKHVGEANWPSLAAFIREVEHWHGEHVDELPHPPWEFTKLDGLRERVGGAG